MVDTGIFAIDADTDNGQIVKVNTDTDLDTDTGCESVYAAKCFVYLKKS